MSNLDSQNVASDVAVGSAHLHSFSTKSPELPPIALFVYNRPEHAAIRVQLTK